MSDDTEYDALQQIGKNCAECLVEMVAALNCDYDRLAELEALGDEIDADDTDEYDSLKKAAGECESREDAETRISEDPLSIELAGTWTLGTPPTADRALILLGTGGPAVRIVCELDDHMEPHRAWIEAQDWGTPWTQCFNVIEQETLLTYCRCFYFSESEESEA